MIYHIITATIIVVLLLTLLGLYIISYYSELKFVKKFSNGTWIDSGGNILIMRLDKKIKISFGINTEDDAYELAESDYDYSMRKIWLSSEYTIKVSNGMKITIDPVGGIATVFEKNKKIGKFAKNNLLLL